MREIKCRAYHKIEKRMYYFDWQTVTQVRYPGYYNPVDRSKDCELSDTSLYEEAQWFTGLKDKRGQEIYEGDILAEGLLYHKSKLRTVEVTSGGWNPFIDDMTTDRPDRYIVIGNIYENSELLEVKV